MLSPKPWILHAKLDFAAWRWHRCYLDLDDCDLDLRVCHFLALCSPHFMLTTSTESKHEKPCRCRLYLNKSLRVIPQAICSRCVPTVSTVWNLGLTTSVFRYGLSIGARAAPFVLVLMYLLCTPDLPYTRPSHSDIEPHQHLSPGQRPKSLIGPLGKMKAIPTPNQSSEPSSNSTGRRIIPSEMTRYPSSMACYPLEIRRSQKS
jgi:hypothetical protein